MKFRCAVDSCPHNLQSKMMAGLEADVDDLEEDVPPAQEVEDREVDAEEDVEEGVGAAGDKAGASSSS
ncbi:unnamed protein product, partial [Ectocarpus sp. 12 AP-2014]